MADPTSFPEANLLLVAPAGQEAAVRPLPVMRTADGRYVSCWTLSAEDLRGIAATGEIWLSVWSGAAPPAVYVGGVKEDVI